MKLQFGSASYVGLLVTGGLADATRLTLQGRRRSQTSEDGFQRRGSIVGTSALNNTGLPHISWLFQGKADTFIFSGYILLHESNSRGLFVYCPDRHRELRSVGRRKCSWK